MSSKINKRINDSINSPMFHESNNKWLELSANYDEEHLIAIFFAQFFFFNKLKMCAKILAKKKLSSHGATGLVMCRNGSKSNNHAKRGKLN